MQADDQLAEWLVRWEEARAADRPARASEVAAELREALGLTVPVEVVEAGALPRFEMKASRFIVEG